MSRIPTHPGRMLSLEFLEPHGLSTRTLAMRIGLPASRIGELVAGNAPMTADTALRLERLFGTPAGFWLRAQAEYDEARARSENDYSGIVPFESGAT